MSFNLVDDPTSVSSRVVAGLTCMTRPAELPCTPPCTPEGAATDTTSPCHPGPPLWQRFPRCHPTRLTLWVFQDFPDITLGSNHCEFSQICLLLHFPSSSYWPRATGASAAGGICGEITFCRAGNTLLQRILTWPKHLWNTWKIDLYERSSFLYKTDLS